MQHLLWRCNYGDVIFYNIDETWFIEFATIILTILDNIKQNILH